MTLHAGFVALHGERKLVVGPTLDWPRVVCRLVHRVARQTRQSALLSSGILKTGGINQAVIFPPRHPHHAIRPEGVADQVRVGRNDCPHGL